MNHDPFDQFPPFPQYEYEHTTIDENTKFTLLSPGAWVLIVYLIIQHFVGG